MPGGPRGGRTRSAVVGGFLIRVLADTLDWPEWVGLLSPFAHLAPVPASGPDWPAQLTMLTVASALTLIGLLGFARRDLRN